MLYLKETARKRNTRTVEHTGSVPDCQPWILRVDIKPRLGRAVLTMYSHSFSEMRGYSSMSKRVLCVPLGTDAGRLARAFAEGDDESLAPLADAYSEQCTEPIKLAGAAALRKFALYATLPNPSQWQREETRRECLADCRYRIGDPVYYNRAPYGSARYGKVQTIVDVRFDEQLCEWQYGIVGASGPRYAFTPTAPLAPQPY